MWINSRSGSVVAGNLTKDPEFKRVGDKQTPLFKLSVAMGKDEQGSNIYADIAAWNRLAELLNGVGLRKGDPIAAFGIWTKKDGNNGKQYWTLNADFVSFINSRAAVMDSAPGVTRNGMPDDLDLDFGDMPDFMK
jgi:single-stranded DNA-binding protein